MKNKIDKISNLSAYTEFSISSFQKGDISSAISSPPPRSIEQQVFVIYKFVIAISTDNLPSLYCFRFQHC